MRLGECWLCDEVNTDLTAGATLSKVRATGPRECRMRVSCSRTGLADFNDYILGAEHKSPFRCFDLR